MCCIHTNNVNDLKDKWKDFLLIPQPTLRHKIIQEDQKVDHQLWEFTLWCRHQYMWQKWGESTAKLGGTWVRPSKRSLEYLFLLCVLSPTLQDKDSGKDEQHQLRTQWFSHYHGKNQWISPQDLILYSIIFIQWFLTKPGPYIKISSLLDSSLPALFVHFFICKMSNPSLFYEFHGLLYAKDIEEGLIHSVKLTSVLSKLLPLSFYLFDFFRDPFIKDNI